MEDNHWRLSCEFLPAFLWTLDSGTSHLCREALQGTPVGVCRRWEGLCPGPSSIQVSLGQQRRHATGAGMRLMCLPPVWVLPQEGLTGLLLLFSRRATQTPANLFQSRPLPY